MLREFRVFQVYQQYAAAAHRSAAADNNTQVHQRRREGGGPSGESGDLFNRDGDSYWTGNSAASTGLVADRASYGAGSCPYRPDASAYAAAAGAGSSSSSGISNSDGSASLGWGDRDTLLRNRMKPTGGPGLNFEPHFTNYTATFQGCLDYVWFDHERVRWNEWG